MKVDRFIRREFPEDGTVSESHMSFNNFYDRLGFEPSDVGARKKGSGEMLAYKLLDHVPPIFHHMRAIALRSKQGDRHIGVLKGNCSLVTVRRQNIQSGPLSDLELNPSPEHQSYVTSFHQLL
jgi:hypothetical protein